MNKEDTRDIIDLCDDVLDKGHPPDVERLLLELELNLNFLKFLYEREKEKKEKQSC
jgi:hypothetical protein